MLLLNVSCVFPVFKCKSSITLSWYICYSCRKVCIQKSYSGKASKETMEEMMARTDRMLLPENVSQGSESRVSMLSLDEDERLIYITKYSPYGFTLNNGLNVFGPSVFFPNACFSWRVSLSEILFVLKKKFDC